MAVLFATCPAGGRIVHAGEQGTPPGRDLLSAAPRDWAQAAASNQEHIINEEPGVFLRYRVRKVDAKGDTTREVIESQEGNVARLVERNGGPLTADENKAERERLTDLLQSPEAFLKHERRERTARTYATELIRLLPQSMLWSYVPGQPQRANLHGTQVVLDFTPDPKFKPPTILSQGLTGIAGRVWIDAQTQHVTRIEGRFLHPVDFGWGGVLARIGEGGTVELEQTQATGQRWMYSRLNEHLTIREVLFHTVSENTQMAAWDAHPLPAKLSFQEAIHALLAMPLQTR